MGTSADVSVSRLVIVEDDLGLRSLLAGLLSDHGYTCEILGSGSEALARFTEQPCDLVLLDYALPDFSAKEIILKAGTSMPPFVVLTGHGDERVAVDLMKLGARDYIVKDSALLDKLPGTVARVLQELRARKQLAAAEAALDRSKAELNAIHEHAPSMMVLLDGNRTVRRINHAAREFFGIEEPFDGRFGDLLGCVHAGNSCGCGNSVPCRICNVNERFSGTMQDGQSHRRFELASRELYTGVLRSRNVLASLALMKVENEPMVLLCLEDVTDRKELEEQFRQAQKMEAVGLLAGGVAHDFNNILTLFTLHLGLLRNDSRIANETKESLQELEAQALRASNLTRQLLLFSRRQVMQPATLQLNQVVESMLRMLRRLLGEHVSIEFEPVNGLPPIKADPGMIEQIIMNLSLNARDVMPGGGRLTFSVSTAELGRGHKNCHPEARPGRFVRLTVADTGSGMDEKAISRVFEPFFTTKPAGKGTGLGLATVFGIVKQHQGWIEFGSTIGKGSTFSIFLPVWEGHARPESRFFDRGADTRGIETDLLVQDDPEVPSKPNASRVLRNRALQYHWPTDEAALEER